VQKPLAACQGKTVPGAVRLVALGRSVSACRSGPRRREVPEADGGGRATPNPGQRRRRCRIRAWFVSEGRHLVHLVADVQREVVKGAANDSVGAVIQRLELRYVAVPLMNTVGARVRSSGSCGGGRWAAAVLCLVAECSAALNVLENCSRKILGGISSESKNWPGKMSGVPNTS
jgi:hypothetical protein